MSRVPSLKQRLEARLFQLNFRANIKEIEKEISVLTEGIDCFYKDGARLVLDSFATQNFRLRAQRPLSVTDGISDLTPIADECL